MPMFVFVGDCICYVCESLDCVGVNARLPQARVVRAHVLRALAFLTLRY